MKNFSFVRSFALVAALALATSAMAAAPPAPVQPTRALELLHLSGRWYEVARVPNLAEKDCAFATTDWKPVGDGKFKVTQTCAKSPDDHGRTITATADPLDPTGNAKWRMNYFGGLIRRDYWVMDHADDDSWLILGMPGKHYVWVLSRQPRSPQAEREQFIEKIAALGYDAGKLVFPLTLASRGN